MKIFRALAWGCALALVAAGANPVQAAWCNAFQVCCNSCGGQGSVIASASPAGCADPCQNNCNPCPSNCCTPRYVQRCYYQPVTSYVTKTYYEPVTTYRTSYYYEPVTSYSYSCYYDPCTCSYQQVACPQTCYRLRQQCCPVTSYLQRCCAVPVTTYQQYCCYEPAPCCPTSSAAPSAKIEAPVATPPGSVIEKSYPSTSPPPMGGVTENSYRRQVVPQASPVRPVPATPQVKLDRIVSAAPGVEGRVITANRAPYSGARLLFVNADRTSSRRDVNADRSGQFRVDLASGGWLVYVYGADGRPTFHSKIEVRQEETRHVTLVSR